MKLNKKFTYYFVLLMLMATGLSAQQFPLSSQYLINPYSLTPTMAGLTGYPEVFLGFRKDMPGINGSPRTFRANGFANVYQNKMWVGGEIFTDKTDILSLFKAQLSYTYKLQVEDEQFLFFGVWTSFYQNSVNIANTVGIDPNDPLINNASKLNASALNAGFGINYNRRDLNIGIAFPTLFANKTEYALNPGFNMRVEKEMLIYASYLFELAPMWKLQAYGVYRKITNEPFNLEISAMAIYMNRFWGGLLYRNSKALSVNVGGLIYRGLTLNYSYDIGLGGINSKSGGAHEISIGWRFKFSGNNYFDKKASPYSRHGKPKKTTRDLPYPQVQEYNYRRR